jgi:hypothetical protein
MVGSRDDALDSHAPSTNRIEFAPSSDREEGDGSIVTDDVRFLRSRMRGSSGFDTPRT